MPIYLLPLIGLGAGVMSGLFGIGGGVVIVPALMLLAKFAPQTATGTSLGVFLLPFGIAGAYQYWRAGHLDIRASLLIGLGLFVGAYFGSHIALGVSPTLLKKLFAVFLAVMAVRLWWTA